MKFDGSLLKKKRKERGLTLQDLADMCATSKSYIWELENNADLKPSGEKVFLMSQALTVPMNYFYGVKEDRTEYVLGTLIVWLSQHPDQPISVKEAGKLLTMLSGEENDTE